MRNDLNAFKEAVKNGKTREEIIEEHSEVFAKYPRFVDEYIKLQLEKAVTRTQFVPRPGWQQLLDDDLKGEAHPRTIIWFTDSVGNSGKSYFANNWNIRQTYIVNGGKAADIYYAYFYEPVVFFDLARQKEDIVAYDVMENFKNGYFLSTKYQVRRVKFNIPHVVVFSNFFPDKTKLSADRWDIRVIN